MKFTRKHGDFLKNKLMNNGYTYGIVYDEFYIINYNQKLNFSEKSDILK